MTIRASTHYPKSVSSFCNQTTSHAMIIAFLYYTSVLDSVIVGCFLIVPINTTSKKKHETIG
jgi:hypothetical protein